MVSLDKWRGLTTLLISLKWKFIPETKLSPRLTATPSMLTTTSSIPHGGGLCFTRLSGQSS
jgi:hypothetical protein